jgi:hypothetical protein
MITGYTVGATVGPVASGSALQWGGLAGLAALRCWRCAGLRQRGELTPPDQRSPLECDLPSRSAVRLARLLLGARLGFSASAFTSALSR